MIGRASIAIALVAIAAGSARADQPAERAADEADEAEHCTPSTALDGPPDLVADIGRMLAARQLPTGNEGRCGVLAIELRRSGDGIVVIREPGSASSEARVVADSSAAATVIESWARVDLASPLLASRPVSAPPARPIAPAEASVIRSIPPPARAGNSLALATGAELGVGRDGSTWSGATLAGCAHVTVMCIGVMARYARDNRTGGDADRLDGTRSALDILLTVESTWQFGDWRIRPGFGIGQGVVYAGIINNGEPDDEENAAVLLRGRVGVGYQISDRWTVELDPAVVYGLGADAIVNDFEEDGTVTPYPGDPGFHFRLGIGLRLEAL